MPIMFPASYLPQRQRRTCWENFLAIQTEQGAIDGKPGLAGQRGRFLAAPILASLAWKLYEKSDDQTFLRAAFPSCINFSGHGSLPNMMRIATVCRSGNISCKQALRIIPCSTPAQWSGREHCKFTARLSKRCSFMRQPV